MGSYPINGRLWASSTAVLWIAFFAWEYWDRPKDSTFGLWARLLTGEGGVWAECAFRSVGLFGAFVFVAVAVYAVLAPATQLARWLTPPPASEQDADYDDKPPAP